ncbi:hypothetical protein [Thermomonospora umbrina]|uniref:hypothetical protein n=1 Tax=Thermomonospora umbrina TaxID=111806 RepID=UPI0011C1AEC5|nr:hypothetical protein [Thermomonospora umbrina]
MRKLQVARAWTGILVVVWVALTYQLLTPEDVASERFNQIWLNILGMCCVFPVVIAGFVFAARPPNRREYLRRLRYPLLALGAQFGAAFTFVLGAAPEFQWLRDLPGPAKPAVAFAAAWFVLLWMAPFCLYGMFLSLTHVFRTADVHELVPPLLTTVLAWVMALIDLATGAYKGVPTGVVALLLLGAPLSVTAVASFEVRRLRVRHGITLRRALLR